MAREKLDIIGFDGHEGLTSEYYIDPDSGEIKAIYTYKGQLVDRIKLSGRIVDRASALSLIIMDLKSAKSWYLRAISMANEKELKLKQGVYSTIDDLDLSNEIKALFVASMIFYGKAFAEAAGRRIKMERNWLDNTFLDKHDMAIDYRNNFAAHSGSKSYESAETALLLFKKNGKTIYQPVTDRKQLSVVSMFDGDDTLISLFDHSISVAENKYGETLKRMGEYVMSKSHYFWSLAANSSEAINLDEANKKK